MIKLKSLLSESKRYINIFYHATDIKPEIILKNGFDVNKVGTHFSKSKNFNGVYFGISPKQVYRFGKYLYKVHIQIDEDKLYQIEEDDFNELSKQGKTTDAYVHANNYEAVVV